MLLLMQLNMYLLLWCHVCRCAVYRCYSCSIELVLFHIGLVGGVCVCVCVCVSVCVRACVRVFFFPPRI
jgi:hypothetical protein